jgi:hypothetical protein
MTSRMRTSNGYTVSLQQRDDIGSLWIVRTHKKVLFFRKLIGSDWFLNSEQARLFAEQLVADLERGSDLIRTRKPGWILRRATR